MSDLVVTIIVLIMMLIGLAGTLFPILPGIVLMWVGTIAYGFSFGFDALGIGVTIVISLFTVLALVLGVVLPKQAAAGAGASSKAQLAAGIGAIIGFFVIPVVGLVVGAVVGIALAEYYEKGDWEVAKGSTIAVAKGFGVSTLAQFAIGVAILLIWLCWAAVETL